jgi:hypothetical protein
MAEIKTAIQVDYDKQISLPADLTTFNARRQKSTLVSFFQESQMALIETLDALEEINRGVKEIKVLIKQSKQIRQLGTLQKQAKELKKRSEAILAERNGALKLTKKLGFNIHEEMKNMRQISAPENN